MSHEPPIAAYWPRAARTQQAEAVAPRLPSLDGKTIAFLWDDLFRGDEIFAVIQRELGQRFAGMRFVPHTEFGSTHGADENEVLERLPGQLRALGVDAVVSGMGC